MQLNLALMIIYKLIWKINANCSTMILFVTILCDQMIYIHNFVEQRIFDVINFWENRTKFEDTIP